MSKRAIALDGIAAQTKGMSHFDIARILEEMGLWVQEDPEDNTRSWIAPLTRSNDSSEAEVGDWIGEIRGDETAEIYIYDPIPGYAESWEDPGEDPRLAALLDTKEYTWSEAGEQCPQTIEAKSVEEALRSAIEQFDPEVYRGRFTMWIDVSVSGPDGDLTETVTVDPQEPDCSAEQHDWRSPRFAGAVGTASGGVRETEVCSHCGTYRITETRVQRPDTGEEGFESVTYHYPDARSLDWVRGQ